MIKIGTLALAGFLSAFTLPALAAPIETTWPAIPGGATFSSSGSIWQQSPGRTWELTLTDPSQVDQIWFGFDDIGAGMDNSTSLLSFSSGIGTLLQQSGPVRIFSLKLAEMCQYKPALLP